MNIIFKRYSRFLTTWFVFPKTHPFHGPLQVDPEIIEIPTIFPTEPPTPYTIQSVQKPQVIFTTGVITVIFVTVTIGVFSIILQNCPTPISSFEQGYVFSLALTTFILGYWILANEDIREFAIRLFKKRICC